MDLQKIKETGLRAASLAAQALVETRASGSLGIEYKSGENDLVTKADLESERRILEVLNTEFPEHRILSEESQSEDISKSYLEGPLWIIDPVDGTTNYAHGLDQCCVSIGFANQGKILFGVVACPFLDSTYYAVKNEGAFKNNIRINVSNRPSLGNSLIATGFPYDKEVGKTQVPLFKKVYEQCSDIRRIGSAALDICYVAEGKLDAYYERVKPWDIAAGRLIAEEAGAKIAWHTKVNNNPYEEYEFNGQNIVISTPEIFKDLLDLLSGS